MQPYPLPDSNAGMMMVDWLSVRAHEGEGVGPGDEGVLEEVVGRELTFLVGVKSPRGKEL